MCRRHSNALLLAGFSVLAACSSPPPKPPPAWPGARFTDIDRQKAVLRGLEFIDRVAKDRKHFTEHGEDLLWCFYTLSEATADPVVRARAIAMGRERAKQWREDNPKLPSHLSANSIYSYVSGNGTATDLGLPDNAMTGALRRASVRYRPEDYLKFDPAKEPIPVDVPEPCSRCNRENPRGRRVCDKCGAKLEMANPYDLLFDALLTTYTAHHTGIWLGGKFEDVVRWIPRLRPYPEPRNGSISDDFTATYTITHIIYTFNDYSRYRLRPEWFPQEFEFLKSHIGRSLAEKDPETLGEFVDSLKSLGMTEAKDPVIRESIEFLMGSQNPDGSWGKMDDSDIYTRYHTTWTGIGGIMTYQWTEGVTVRAALRRLQGP